MVGKHLLGIFKLVSWAANRHASKWIGEPKKGARYWNYCENNPDGAIPYEVHSAWCTFSILQETQILSEIRTNGAAALALHDILEDTDTSEDEVREYLCQLREQDLLVVNPDKVIKLIREMMFESSEQQRQEIWNRSNEARLLKLYDKVSNLLDGAWMTPDKWNEYAGFTQELADDVKTHFGDLNIVRMARAIVGRGKPPVSFAEKTPDKFVKLQ
jgi:(p)ppGpp synthase/HD superfamily hydrolase